MFLEDINLITELYYKPYYHNQRQWDNENIYSNFMVNGI